MKLAYGVSGVEVPDDCVAAVSFRAILRGGVLDILWDRSDRHFASEGAKGAMVDWYGDRAMDWLDQLAEKVRGNDTTVYVLDEGPFHARASAQASYGYLYVTLWMDGGGGDD